MLKFRCRKREMDTGRSNGRIQAVQDRAQGLFEDIDRSQFVTMSRDDVKNPLFWKSVLGELIGCLVLVLFGCGSWIETDVEEHPMTVRIAFTFGFMYAVVLYSLRPVSGGHINPIVTIAMAVTQRISLARAVFYCLAQLVGAIIGAALLLAFTPLPYRDMLGTTNTATELSAEQGFGVELFSSFFFVFVVFSCYSKVDKLESPAHSLFTPFIIGFAAVAIHLFAIPFTGASINPARSFGPSVVTGNWKDHWIYWFGPIIGGTLGGVVQHTAFGAKAPLRHLQKCMLVQEEDHENRDQTRVPINAIVPQNFPEIKQDYAAVVPQFNVNDLKKNEGYTNKALEVPDEAENRNVTHHKEQERNVRVELQKDVPDQYTRMYPLVPQGTQTLDFESQSDLSSFTPVTDAKGSVFMKDESLAIVYPKMPQRTQTQHFESKGDLTSITPVTDARGSVFMQDEESSANMYRKIPQGTQTMHFESKSDLTTVTPLTDAKGSVFLHEDDESLAISSESDDEDDFAEEEIELKLSPFKSVMYNDKSEEYTDSVGGSSQNIMPEVESPEKPQSLTLENAADKPERLENAADKSQKLDNAPDKPQRLENKENSQDNDGSEV